MKCAWRGEFSQLAGEAQLVAPVAQLEEVEQLAAEHAAEHAHGEEESASAGNPAGVIERQSAGGDETV